MQLVHDSDWRDMEASWEVARLICLHLSRDIRTFFVFVEFLKKYLTINPDTSACLLLKPVPPSPMVDTVQLSDVCFRYVWGYVIFYK